MENSLPLSFVLHVNHIVFLTNSLDYFIWSLPLSKQLAISCWQKYHYLISWLKFTNSGVLVIRAFLTFLGSCETLLNYSMSELSWATQTCKYLCRFMCYPYGTYTNQFISQTVILYIKCSSLVLWESSKLSKSIHFQWHTLVIFQIQHIWGS